MRRGSAQYSSPRSTTRRERGVEAVLVDPEGVVQRLDGAPGVREVDRDAVVERDDGEGAHGAGRGQAEDVGEEAGRLLLVAGGHDRVIQLRHRVLARQTREA